MNILKTSDLSKLKGINFVEVFSNGCLGCTMLKRLIEKEEKNNSSITFNGIAIDNAMDLVESLNLKALPSIIVVKDGKVLESTAVNHAKINKSLDELVVKYQ